MILGPKTHSICLENGTPRHSRYPQLLSIGDFIIDFKETSWNYISDDNIAYFSSSERKWITKIRKLAEANPNEVKIVREPEDNGGTIYAQVPATWLYVRKPKQVNMTEEQRAAAAERLKNARNS